MADGIEAWVTTYRVAFYNYTGPGGEKERSEHAMRAVIEAHVRPMVAAAHLNGQAAAGLDPQEYATRTLTPLLSQKDEAAPWIDTGGVTSHPKDKYGLRQVDGATPISDAVSSVFQKGKSK